MPEIPGKMLQNIPKSGHLGWGGDREDTGMAL